MKTNIIHILCSGQVTVVMEIIIFIKGNISNLKDISGCFFYSEHLADFQFYFI